MLTKDVSHQHYEFTIPVEKAMQERPYGYLLSHLSHNAVSTAWQSLVCP